MLTDFAKLLIILLISALFTSLVLVFFHFWRKIRKDKLQLSQYSSEYLDEDISAQIDPNVNKLAFFELTKLKRAKPSAGLSIKSK
jgi:hypothetical protein